MIKQQIGIPNINSVTHSEQAGKLAHDDSSDDGFAQAAAGVTDSSTSQRHPTTRTRGSLGTQTRESPKRRGGTQTREIPSSRCGTKTRAARPACTPGKVHTTGTASIPGARPVRRPRGHAQHAVQEPVRHRQRGHAQHDQPRRVHNTGSMPPSISRISFQEQLVSPAFEHHCIGMG